MAKRQSGGTVLSHFDMWIPERAKAELAEAARREGCSLKTYLLAGAFERLHRQPVLKPAELEPLVDLHEQLRRAGINLNGVLRSGFLAETSRRPAPLEADYAQAAKEVADTLTKIEALIDGFRKWAV